jgi:hypothetical protein
MSRSLTCLALLAMVGCRSAPTPIRMQGETGSIAQLQGSWEGEYWGGAQGRRGSIVFVVPEGSQGAFGDVVMMAPGGQPIRAVDTSEQHRMHTTSSQGLRIDFVNVGNGSVSGQLEPYMAPDCDCVVTTSFLGNLVGDTLSGTFTTRSRTNRGNDGFWKVVRRK